MASNGPSQAVGSGNFSRKPNDFPAADFSAPAGPSHPPPRQNAAAVAAAPQTIQNQSDNKNLKSTNRKFRSELPCLGDCRLQTDSPRRPLSRGVTPPACLDVKSINSWEKLILPLVTLVSVSLVSQAAKPGRKLKAPNVGFIAPVISGEPSPSRFLLTKCEIMFCEFGRRKCVYTLVFGQRPSILLTGRKPLAALGMQSVFVNQAPHRELVRTPANCQGEGAN